jgi:hypothetical protein
MKLGSLMYTDSQSISSSADKTDESGFCPEMGTVGKKTSTGLMPMIDGLKKISIRLMVLRRKKS